MRLMIDAGHGINTKGKRSPDGRLLEYRYARRVASEVVRRLAADGYQAGLVTDERASRVNAWCDRMGRDKVLLVSVHCNAAGPGDRWMNARGWEAWTSPGQTRGDLLAECLYDAAQKHLPAGTPIRTDLSDGDRDKEALFTILNRTRCAACLTENLFQDNKADVDYLLSDEGFEAIVRLHVDGIKEYVSRQQKR